MRYKKGSRVEILWEDEMPSGSWRPAEILSGTRYNYSVRYDVCTVLGEAFVERVSSKFIRPCPPSVELADDLILGEILEVFHNFSWKMATVSKVLGRNFVVVRLVGSSQELKVRKNDLRVRQCWENGTWSIIGKVSINKEDRKQSERLNLKYIPDSGCWAKRDYANMNFHVKDQYSGLRDNIYFQEPLNMSAKTLKRGSPWLKSQGETEEGSPRKFIAAERKGRAHRFAVYPLTEKVEPAASKKFVGKNHLNAPSNNRTTCFVEKDVHRKEQNGYSGCSSAIGLEPTDVDCSSVDSCSVNSNSPFKSPYHSSSFQDNESYRSDAESFCHLGFEEIPLSHTRKELAEEIHRLELHAYRCTIEALHASGPLSWEQETLLTNLRISLHISNDEHLMELRNLVSTDSYSCY